MVTSSRYLSHDDEDRKYLSPPSRFLSPSCFFIFRMRGTTRCTNMHSYEMWNRFFLSPISTCLSIHSQFFWLWIEERRHTRTQRMPPPTSSRPAPFEFLPALKGNLGGGGSIERSILEQHLTDMPSALVARRGGPPRQPPRPLVGRPNQHRNPSSTTTVGLHRSRGRGNLGVDSADAETGALSCLQRGLVPSSTDITTLLTGAAEGGLGPLSVGTAPIHKHVEQFRRQDILTADYGISPLGNVKLDGNAIAAIPRDATLASMRAAASGSRAHDVPTLLPVATTTTTKSATEGGSAIAVSTKERDDIRTYTELLDLYSLHEFIIRKGQTLRATPEFVSYQRSYQSNWGPISQAIGDLEKLLGAFNIPIAYVDGKKLAALAAVDMGKPSREELLACLANRPDVEPLMVSSAQTFRQGGKTGQELAAIKIQSVIRMFLKLRAYARLKIATIAAKRIQRQWGVFRNHIATTKTLNALREALFARWKDTMSAFVANWPKIRDGRKVVVHLLSLSYPAMQLKTTPFLAAHQAAHLPRLASLVDPLTDLVVICPFKIDSDAMGYYYSMLAAAGVSAPDSRVMLLVPENIDRLPSWVSLSRALLCSPKLLRSLSALLRGKTAYIVPTVIGSEERVLAATLNLPMLGPDPRIALALGTKSGARTIFDAADALVPVGAHNLQSEADVYAAIGKLAAEYPGFPRWLIKLDLEHGGRGTAFLDVRRLRTFETLEDGPPLSGTQLAEKIVQELTDTHGRRIRPVRPEVYPDWPSMARLVPVGGCCVEAVPQETLSSPVANVLIEPDGTSRLLSVQEQLFTPHYVPVGWCHPHNPVIPYEAIRDAALSIASAAYRKRVMGYLTIDFVTFRKASHNSKSLGGAASSSAIGRAAAAAPDDSASSLRLWAVDIDMGWTPAAAMHSLIVLVTGARQDPTTGRVTTVPAGTADGSSSEFVPPGSPTSSSGARTLHYVFSGLLYHPYIGALRHSVFFALCRQRGLSYDSHTRAGVVYQLVDVLLRGAVGAAAIGTTAQHAISQMVDFLDLLQAQLIAANAPFDEPNTNVPSVVAAARNVAQKLSGSKRGGGGSVAALGVSGGGASRR